MVSWYISVWITLQEKNGTNKGWLKRLKYGGYLHTSGGLRDSCKGWWGTQLPWGRMFALQDWRNVWKERSTEPVSTVIIRDPLNWIWGLQEKDTTPAKLQSRGRELWEQTFQPLFLLLSNLLALPMSHTYLSIREFSWRGHRSQLSRVQKKVVIKY